MGPDAKGAALCRTLLLAALVGSAFWAVLIGLVIR